MRRLAVWLAALGLAAACMPAVRATAPSGANTLPPATSPAGAATEEVERLRARADIKLENAGQTFTYTVTSRFTVFLDDTDYYAGDLGCEPEGIVGVVSNGSVRGPDLYPVMFEAVRPGQCELRDGDFTATIVVTE